MINKLKQWAKDIGLKLLEMSGENYGPVTYRKNEPLESSIPKEKFKRRATALFSSEQSMYEVLLKAFNQDNYYVFPQYSIGMLIWYDKKQSNNKTPDEIKHHMYSLLQLHVDFLIVEKENYKIYCAIELDGDIHFEDDYYKDKKDPERNKLFDYYQIPLARIISDPENIQTPDEIRILVNEARRKNKPRKKYQITNNKRYKQ